MGLPKPCGILVEACVSPAGSPPVPATCGEGIAGFPSFSGPLIIVLWEALIFRSADDWIRLEKGESNTFRTISHDLSF